MSESNNAQQMVNSFDFATIDEMDPSLGLLKIKYNQNTYQSK